MKHRFLHSKLRFSPHTAEDGPLRVVIVIDNRIPITHGVLSGIRAYERETRHSVMALPGRDDDTLASCLEHWRPHGLIGVYHTPLIDEAVARGLTAVGLYSSSDLPANVRVYNAPEPSARVVAEELIGRHLRHLGVVETSLMTPAMRVRAEAFEREGRSHGCTFARYVPAPQTSPGAFGDMPPDVIPDLSRWIEAQPRPLGLWAIKDACGWQVLQACEMAGLRVPGDVAVIGYGNDQPICEFCEPELSSLAINDRRIGYEASALLHRLMRGEPPPAEPIRVPPMGVVQRQSSNTVAVEDPVVAEALSFIREHLHEGIRVEDVLDHVPASASTLLRRFKQHLNRSPAEELRRLRLETTKRHLLASDRPLVEVAVEVGYEHVSQFCRDFKKAMGQTPTEFRERNSG